MFLRKFLNKKNLVNIFNKFKNYEIYGLVRYDGRDSTVLTGGGVRYDGRWCGIVMGDGY